MSEDIQSRFAASVEESSIKETIESIAIAFILAFVFRAFVIEAFVIPTGSMAPTLLGSHLRIVCPECGYRFNVGPRDYHGSRQPKTYQGTLSNPVEIACPMCDYPIRRNEPQRLDSGDRILVLKFIYAFLEPRRWDVVVFKNPENPQENYIKRLIGLPEEQVWIVDGNIFVRKGEETKWRIARKPEEIQRAVWLPIYHSKYVPLDEGRGDKRRYDVDYRAIWDQPWRPADDSRWEPLHETRARRFGGEGEGVLNFAFNRRSGRRSFRDYYPYNAMSNQGTQAVETVVDRRVAARVVPERDGLRLWLSTSNHTHQLRGVIEADGRVRLQRRPLDDPQSPWQTLQAETVDLPPLPAGRASRVELWYVDQALSLWMDGQRVAVWRYDRGNADLYRRVIGDMALGLGGQERRRLVEFLTHGRWQPPNIGTPSYLLESVVKLARQAMNEQALASEQILEIVEARRMDSEQSVSVGVSGAAARLFELNLDRDLYYTQGQTRDYAPEDAPRAMPLGTHARPADLGPDEFFCLGDNSPQSKDGRLWTTVNPWVHDRTGVSTGRVPRELMIGRAFFVYYPAPFRLYDRTMAVVPNFGRMRFIH